MLLFDLLNLIPCSLQCVRMVEDVRLVELLNFMACLFKNVELLFLLKITKNNTQAKPNLLLVCFGFCFFWLFVLFFFFLLKLSFNLITF